MYNIYYSVNNKNKGSVKMQILQKIALVVTIIGAVNWGLIGLFDFNLVNALFGSIEFLEKAIYVIVGITGLINIGLLFMDIHED